MKHVRSVDCESLDAADGDAQAAPVFVLTYGHAGGERLQALLSAYPDLECPSAGAWMMMFSDYAAVAWQADLRGLSPEPVRPTLWRRTTALDTWQRVALAYWSRCSRSERVDAELFSIAFPGTRFLCLHRSCPDLISATLAASHWGLAGHAYASYTAAYPASTVAALAAWWADHAREVLAFEQAHPQECLRVRYEDLNGVPGQVESDIVEFLGLVTTQRLPEVPAENVRHIAADIAAGGEEFPVAQIPAPLLAQVNGLHATLGYPLLGR